MSIHDTVDVTLPDAVSLGLTTFVSGAEILSNRLTCESSQLVSHLSSLQSQSINQTTFIVFRTHQGSQQTVTGNTTYKKH